MHFTPKQKPIKCADFDEFVARSKSGGISNRRSKWREKKPEGRWRCFEVDELMKRDKVSLDLFWLKDESLEDGDSLPNPEVLATEIADDLQAAMEQFAAIAGDLAQEE